jgi:hypothetical protein
MALSTVKMTVYPIMVGLMLGLLQVGLFFQLTSMLSSGFGTYLMITLCWLIGSAVGVTFGARIAPRTTYLLVLALASYGLCGFLLSRLPFETESWPAYAVLVALIGTYPGLFFARMASVYRARTLFLLENNGFIIGMVTGTLLLMLVGRVALWIAPVAVGVTLCLLREPTADRLPAIA